MANASTTSDKDSAFPGLPRVARIPTNIVSQDLLSTTSLAPQCFPYQRFAGRLQAYLVDYVANIYGDYPVYH